MSNRVMHYRMVSMVVVCLTVPPLLGFLVGAALGALGAVGAAGFWFSQYRLPAWEDRGGPSFWLVAGGYGVIGLNLLVCLGRLVGVRLL
jgi:hypothetical protein